MKGTTLPGQVGLGPALQQQTEHKPQHLLYSYKAIRDITSAAQNPFKHIKARIKPHSPNSAGKREGVCLTNRQHQPATPPCESEWLPGQRELPPPGSASPRSL